MPDDENGGKDATDGPTNERTSELPTDRRLLRANELGRRCCSFETREKVTFSSEGLSEWGVSVTIEQHPLRLLHGHHVSLIYRLGEVLFKCSYLVYGWAVIQLEYQPTSQQNNWLYSTDTVITQTLVMEL